jgi:hypothetical protein
VAEPQIFQILHVINSCAHLASCSESGFTLLKDMTQACEATHSLTSGTENEEYGALSSTPCMLSWWAALPLLYMQSVTIFNKNRQLLSLILTKCFVEVISK